MRDLCQGVDACIGAPRPVQLEITPSGDGANRLIDLTLNRPCVLLDLPAAVPRASVLDGQLEARHGFIVRCETVSLMNLSGCGIDAFGSRALVSLIPTLLTSITTLVLAIETRTG